MGVMMVGFHHLFHVPYKFIDEALDIKLGWLKARARAHRWKEELILVDEEMRRCLRVLQMEIKLVAKFGKFTAMLFFVYQGVNAGSSHRGTQRICTRAFFY